MWVLEETVQAHIQRRDVAENSLLPPNPYCVRKVGRDNTVPLANDIVTFTTLAMHIILKGWGLLFSQNKAVLDARKV